MKKFLSIHLKEVIKVKKRFVSICMVCAVLLGVYSPASAASFTERDKLIDQSKSILIPDKTNEYDYIVEIREAAKKSNSIVGISTEEVEYITSDAIEKELLYRASLSDKALKEQYCYTDDAIDTLRKYDGERLESNADLRELTATLSASLGELVRSGTRMGIIYTWTWDYKPLVRFTDYAAMSWDGTYENGGTNNMLFDQYMSFAIVNYYYTDANQNQNRYEGYEFESDNTYHGAAISFPAEKWINGCYYWAKYGSLFVYTDLVNQDSGPALYELNTHAEFAHYTIGAAFDGVSFPWGISISFTGAPSIIGVRNLCVRP